MQAYVIPDDRATTKTYDRGLTAVNAPNVHHQAVTSLIEPFQPRSRYPIGAPPLRYPDVTTIPGFIDNPEQDAMDARNVAARMADAYDAADAMPYQWDGQAVTGSAYQKNTMGDVPRGELIRRVLMPVSDAKPMTAW